jgi:hypothetical protein
MVNACLLKDNIVISKQEENKKQSEPSSSFYPIYPKSIHINFNWHFAAITKSKKGPYEPYVIEQTYLAKTLSCVRCRER